MSPNGAGFLLCAQADFVVSNLMSKHEPSPVDHANLLDRALEQAVLAFPQLPSRSSARVRPAPDVNPRKSQGPRGCLATNGAEVARAFHMIISSLRECLEPGGKARGQ